MSHETDPNTTLVNVLGFEMNFMDATLIFTGCVCLVTLCVCTMCLIILYVRKQSALLHRYVQNSENNDRIDRRSETQQLRRSVHGYPNGLQNGAISGFQSGVQNGFQNAFPTGFQHQNNRSIQNSNQNITQNMHQKSHINLHDITHTSQLNLTSPSSQNNLSFSSLKKTINLLDNNSNRPVETQRVIHSTTPSPETSLENPRRNANLNADLNRSMNAEIGSLDNPVKLNPAQTNPAYLKSLNRKLYSHYESNNFSQYNPRLHPVSREFETQNFNKHKTNISSKKSTPIFKSTPILISYNQSPRKQHRRRRVSVNMLNSAIDENSENTDFRGKVKYFQNR